MPSNRLGVPDTEAVRTRTLSTQAFISIGSNIEPQRHLPLAIRKLDEHCRITAVSSVYQSPAVGAPDQPDYLNAAVLVLTDQPPDDLRRLLRVIEADLGRVRAADRCAARTIDLDLCVFGDAVVVTPDWTLPHPEITQRAFVAIPLAELAPTFVHPLTGETLSTIADSLRSTSRLVKRPDVVLDVITIRLSEPRP